MGINLTTLVHGDKTLIGQFKISKGSAIPTHPHERTGIMIFGKLCFLVDGEIKDVEVGESWCLPGGVGLGRIADQMRVCR